MERIVDVYDNSERKVTGRFNQASGGKLVREQFSMSHVSS